MAKNPIKGTVSGFQQRYEPTGRGLSRLVWDFRLERQDAAGNALPRVAVQMRGRSFEGSVANGDQVEVEGSPREGVILARRVRNLTSNATVRSTSGLSPGGRVSNGCAIIFALIFALLVLGWILYVFASGGGR